MILLSWGKSWGKLPHHIPSGDIKWFILSYPHVDKAVDFLGTTYDLPSRIFSKPTEKAIVN